jgi:sodium-type flagellar protein MotY
MLNRCLLLIPILLLSTSSQAVRHYYANIEQAQWQVESSRLRCELNQTIPYYGKGSFVISAGGEMSFMVNTHTAMPKDSTVSIMSIPPFWRSSESKELVQSVLSKGHMPFHVTGELASRMLYELDTGMHPTFKYKDSYDDKLDILVSLSSARFQDKLHDFQHCIGQLIPYGVDELKSVTINFKTNKHALSSTAMRDLEILALFASEDRKIKIMVEGFTDSAGSRRHNKALSKRRTGSVVKYFRSFGVDASQITAHSYGERHPSLTNKKDMGKAFNRRVEVSFSRNL